MLLELRPETIELLPAAKNPANSRRNLPDTDRESLPAAEFSLCAFTHYAAAYAEAAHKLMCFLMLGPITLVTTSGSFCQ